MEHARVLGLGGSRQPIVEADEHQVRCQAVCSFQPVSSLLCEAFEHADRELEEWVSQDLADVAGAGTEDAGFDELLSALSGWPGGDRGDGG